jgi:hypothetical protein
VPLLEFLASRTREGNTRRTTDTIRQRDPNQPSFAKTPCGAPRERILAVEGEGIVHVPRDYGESPASADYPVGTVVISVDGVGDQTVESPDVNVLVGWMQIWSAPTGGQAKQQVVA